MIFIEFTFRKETTTPELHRGYAHTVPLPPPVVNAIVKTLSGRRGLVRRLTDDDMVSPFPLLPLRRIRGRRGIPKGDGGTPPFGRGRGGVIAEGSSLGREIVTRRLYAGVAGCSPPRRERARMLPAVNVAERA